ncbi:DUF6415 family natural product biosynthesis protein [Streptomyces sp. NPDC093085]|uniref:DUF6415 family natural product biosynthesis protein n=1 Tax=Streptomyces sp. NPDC093085 TaxID=3155068 RepID=UPI00343A1DFE
MSAINATSAAAAIGRWLASSIRDPESAYRDWRDGRPAVLALGVQFDAVKLPQRLVNAAAGAPERSAVTTVLAPLGGPVIWSPPGWYLALVPAGTAAGWDLPYAGALGQGTYLTVPRPDRTGPAGIHWAVPPAHARTLCSPGAVARLLADGHRRQGGTRVTGPGATPALVSRADIEDALAKAAALGTARAGEAELGAAAERLRTHIAALLPAAEAHVEGLWPGGPEWYPRRSRLDSIRHNLGEHAPALTPLSAQVRLALLHRDCAYLLEHYGNARPEDPRGGPVTRDHQERRVAAHPHRRAGESG